MGSKVNKKATEAKKPQYIILLQGIGAWEAIYVHSQATNKEIQAAMGYSPGKENNEV